MTYTRNANYRFSDDCSDKQAAFLEKARRTHGARYAYDQAVYVSASKPITVTCNAHGPYVTTPYIHIGGSHCPYCAKRKRYTTEAFISQAKERHGDRYDYSKVVADGGDSKVTIICRKHGEYGQKVGAHVRGQGCIHCKIEADRTGKTLTTEEFITRSKAVHNNFYSYDKVLYTRSKLHVLITCPKHGEFKQKPKVHLRGGRCKLCCYEETSTRFKSNTEDFIQKAEEKHGTRFDYSEVDYINSEQKVKINCRRHGPFFQDPHGHLKGYGCVRCVETGGERAVSKVLDKLGVSYVREFTLQDNPRLRYDFYIPTHNVFVEFHGEQHFRRIPFFHRQPSDFHKQVFRDEIKVKLIAAYNGALIVLTDEHLVLNTLECVLTDHLKRLKVVPTDLSSPAL